MASRRAGSRRASLLRRAVRFARDNPGRVLALAIVKLGRFCSPWPNAEQLDSRAVTAAGAAVELPLFGLLAVGAWNRRRDLRVWVHLGRTASLLHGPAPGLRQLNARIAFRARCPRFHWRPSAVLRYAVWWRDSGPGRRLWCRADCEFGPERAATLKPRATPWVG